MQEITEIQDKIQKLQKQRLIAYKLFTISFLSQIPLDCLIDAYIFSWWSQSTKILLLIATILLMPITIKIFPLYCHVIPGIELKLKQTKNSLQNIYSRAK